MSACARHQLPNCPVCPGGEPPRVSGWERFGRLLGYPVGLLGRLLADAFEWTLYAVVFGLFFWIGADLMGLHLGWKFVGGAMIVFRTVILATHSAWTAAVKANAK